MKRIFTIITAVLLTATLCAQSPEKMSYQAVIRNSSDQLIVNQQVGMQISILHGSASGTAVYSETQSPTTNANGLVSIEIGDGTEQNGDLSALDWANGPYFIKTETDLAGGTSYTITGTSQLLSVPYALHAKTAEMVTGTVSETDPIFNTSEASGISATDITNWNNKQDQLTAGTGIIITDNEISTTGSSPLSIGDSYQGGIIFWLDASGQHGLIAATEDQSTGVLWSNGTFRYTGTTGDGLYAGIMNTTIIVATQMADNQTGNFAAKVCADYSVKVGDITYGDWYLPSEYELSLLYQQKAAIGGFVSGFYWSSTETNDFLAWKRDFYNGHQNDVYKNDTNRVRAIRAF